MRGECKPTMTWEEAPDTISPKELAKILGIGINNARNIFDKPDFPKISKADIGNIGKADKEAARLYIQGIKIKNNSKEALLSMIYFELRKITANNEIDMLKSDLKKGKESVENEKNGFYGGGLSAGPLPCRLRGGRRRGGVRRRRRRIPAGGGKRFAAGTAVRRRLHRRHKGGGRDPGSGL